MRLLRLDNVAQLYFVEFNHFLLLLIKIIIIVDSKCKTHPAFQSQFLLSSHFASTIHLRYYYYYYQSRPDMKNVSIMVLALSLKVTEHKAHRSQFTGQSNKSLIIWRYIFFSRQNQITLDRYRMYCWFLYSFCSAFVGHTI